METDILKLILNSHGSMNTDELHYNLCEPSFLAELVGQKKTFASSVISGQHKVVVRSRLKLCGTVDCPGCGRLHLCVRYLLSGRCPFTNRGGCHFSHDHQSEYNMTLLSEFGLQTLSRYELSLLLLQSNNALLPEMCNQYNNRGSCQDDCQNLHMCKLYLHQDCSCPKNHDFCAPQPLRLLQEKHIPEHLFRLLKSVYANKEALKLADKADRSRDGHSDSSSIGTKQSRGRGSRGRGRGRGSYRGQRGRQTASGFDGATYESEESGRGKLGRDPGKKGSRGNRGGRPGGRDLTGEEDLEEPGVGETSVCGVETECTGEDAQDATVASDGKTTSNAEPSNHPSPVKNVEVKSSGPSTRQRARRSKAHHKMPYQWEIKQDGQWTHMAENESIERDYCNPDNTYSSTIPPVHFDTMRCKSDEVRRLSTVNTTDWLWYWEDEHGKWCQYAAMTSEHHSSTITSKQLEELYLQDNKDVVTFTAGSQSYELSFSDMLQTNLRYGTERLVRRRPWFVSSAQVLTQRRQPTLSTTVPDDWDKTQIPQIGFKRVPLQPSSGEYKRIKNLFDWTMADFEIITIERIQNRVVWEAFQLHKTHMKQKNGGQPVLEMQLFHGTEPEFVDTICETNFDWRVCGVNGTLYGQGSYFARDARYSHDYTGATNPRFMFVSRVLVGDFALGSSEYRRAPSKDGGNVNLFDSCVNDLSNPKVFVVFKEQQIYPEYLLQYRHYPSYSRQTTYTSYRTVPPPRLVSPSPSVPPAPTNQQNSCVIV